MGLDGGTSTGWGRVRPVSISGSTGSVPCSVRTVGTGSVGCGGDRGLG